MRTVVDSARAKTGSTMFLDLVEQHLTASLEGHSGAVAESARRSITAGGKRMRPLLVWAGRPRSAPFDAWQQVAIRAAAAVELVHTATLIHDDVLDRADERRGQPTVLASAGRHVAVAAGDLLFASAFATLAKTDTHLGTDRAVELVHALAIACRTLAQGEALQAEQVRDVTIDEHAYLERCRMKTGVLFGVSLALGALAGDASRERSGRLMRFGTEVGTAFQVADDILDLAPAVEAARLGKLPHADIRDGTITLPMIYALETDPGLAELLQSPGPDTATTAARIRATGSCELASARARSIVQAARDAVDGLDDDFDLEALDVISLQAIDRLS